MANRIHLQNAKAPTLRSDSGKGSRSQDYKLQNESKSNAGRHWLIKPVPGEYQAQVSSNVIAAVQGWRALTPTIVRLPFW